MPADEHREQARERSRSPRAKDAEREYARVLRREGLTYDEIAARLGVSKSSVSLWVRDLAHPPTSRAGEDARHAGARRYFDQRRRRVLIERQNEKLAWSNALGALSDRELLIAGTVAYWAEGTKAKPWRPSERVTFVNSDPGMIMLKRHTASTNRKNVGAGYHGCLSVSVLKSAALYRRIEGTWWAVRQAAVRPAGTV